MSGQKVKAVREFLGIPAGSIGVIMEKTTAKVSPFGTASIKFDCKNNDVILQYPFESHYTEVDDEIVN